MVISIFFLMNWSIIFPFLIYTTAKSCKRKRFDKSILDEGGPMTYNIKTPAKTGPNRPRLSVQELRKKIAENHPSYTHHHQIKIKKVPAISKSNRPFPNISPQTKRTPISPHKISSGGSPAPRRHKPKPSMNKH